MPRAVIDRDLGYRKVVGRLLGLGNLGVTVGVHEDEGQDIVTRAAVNEFGSDDGHVPERSFLRSTLDTNDRSYSELLADGVDRLIDGEQPSAAFAPLSRTVVDDVQRKIDEGVPPANAKSTIEAKGHGHTLIESGDLRKSITARVSVIR